MKKKIADRWIAALRSGKYVQAKDALCSNAGFCCLGVLCDLSEKGAWVASCGPSNPRDYLGTGSELPHEVSRWAGMRSLDGRFDSDNPEHQPPGAFEPSLLQLNDTLEFTFPQIADVIEQHWERM